jgi:hypothetical protein
MFYAIIISLVVGIVIGGLGVWYYGIKRPQLKNKVVAAVAAEVKKV